MADKLILHEQPEISEENAATFRLKCKRALLMALKERFLLDDPTIQAALDILETEK